MTTGTQMTTRATRVIDPVLSTAARGYRNGMFIWPYIFPPVTVQQRGGNVIEFDAEHFHEMELRRAPGGQFAEINLGYTGKPYTCEQRGLVGKVPVEHMEEAAMVPGINLGMTAIDRVMRTVHQQIEIEAASQITPATFVGRTEALAGNRQWSHADSTPAKEVAAKFNMVRTGIGISPNTLAVGKEVHDQTVNNPDVVDRIKHTQAATTDVIDDKMLARYFGVERYVVGNAMKGKKGEFQDIWGKIALLCFSDVTPLSQMGSPSFAYTYQLAGHPAVRAPYFDDDTDSWKYKTVTEDTPVIAGISAAFLWTNVVM